MISQIRLQLRYMVIEEMSTTDTFPVVLLCEIAQVSRAAYYKWLKRTVSVREEENLSLLEDIRLLYDQVNRTYGYRRITMTVNRRRRQHDLPAYNEKRIYRLMRIHEIRSVIRQKRKRHKKSSPQHVAENVLNREFTVKKPNEKWVTDVTEFKYGLSKKAYLSVIRDLYDGSIISYVLGHSNNNQLVFKTLDQAIVRLHQEHPLIHSDRGFQYTSKAFKRKLEAAGMTQSMSRVGRCIDNGPMESFFGTLKCEKYYLHKYQTFEELNIAINEYIYFYNHERYQKRLNGLSPKEYRAKAA